MTRKLLLHELLKEDQEPFHLHDFIARHRTTTTTTTLSTTTTTTIAGKSTKPNFCINHICLFSLQNSPDFPKSPFLEFQAAQNKSPCHNMLINIPSRTAAMLLEAATRVQKPKHGSRKPVFGLFGTILKRIKAKRLEPISLKQKPMSNQSPDFIKKNGRKKSFSSGSHWSEKTSGSSCSSSRSRILDEEDEIECCCSNPESPFRFSLRKDSPEVGRNMGEDSPAMGSPSCHFRQDKDSYEGDCPQEIHRQEDDEKEQCSPVSVLDPLFDDDEEEERDDGTIEEDDYDIDCTYASVQRAKHQLLLKLQRFERLAGLDPINLEKYMLEQHYSEDEDEEEGDDEYVIANGEELTNEELFREIMNHLGVGKLPWYMKKLVLDLITEENKNEEQQVIVQKVCKRLHSWKVVELNTIDMMVEEDFKNEGWRRCDEETIRETGMDIEAGIFGFLVEELAQELNSSWQ